MSNDKIQMSNQIQNPNDKEEQDYKKIGENWKDYMHREDRQINTLVEILKKRKVISDEDVNQALSLEPFPQLQ